MQFVYLRTCVQLYLVCRSNFPHLCFTFCQNAQKKTEKNVTGKKLNVVQGVGAIPIPKKNCNPFALFSFANTPLSNDRMKIFIYSSYHFLLQLPSYPPNPFYLNTSSLGKVN